MPGQRVRKRKAIEAGNKAYNAKDYSKALKDYESALEKNPASLVALFNKALATTRVATGMPDEQKEKKQQTFEQAVNDFTAVTKHVKDNPSLASQASYNLGNLAFNNKDYQSAIDHYKQALRLNPNDNNARKNLRIAQLNQQKNKQDDKKDQNQNQGGGQDNKDKQDQKQNQQDKQNQDNQNKNQDKQENKDNNNQDKQNQQPQKPKQQPQGMSQQAADRILKRSADKEKETRKRTVYGRQNQNQGNPYESSSRAKKW